MLREVYRGKRESQSKGRENELTEMSGSDCFSLWCSQLNYIMEAKQR
jgi:hypothetical protein